jgi:hypothetical protein
MEEGKKATHTSKGMHKDDENSFYYFEKLILQNG